LAPEEVKYAPFQKWFKKSKKSSMKVLYCVGLNKTDYLGAATLFTALSEINLHGHMRSVFLQIIPVFFLS
jgi:hypothetical protein